MMRFPAATSPSFAKFVEGLATADGCPAAGLRPHQRAVANFLAGDTPYRGLLIMHSVGSGKSITAAAVIAANASSKKAWAILPASLKENFAAALRTPASAAEFACRGGRPADDVTYLSLNGLTRKRVGDLEAAGNPFDGCVVVVDECHTMIQAVAKSGDEPTLTKRVYDLLLDAQRVKLVLLSATPLINLPRELAYLANLVRGRIVTHSVRWSPPLRSEQMAAAKAALAAVPSVTSVRVDHGGALMELAPEGFVRAGPSALARAPAGHNPVAAVLRAAAPWAGKDAALERRAGRLFDPHAFEQTFVDAATGDVIGARTLSRALRGLISSYASDDGDSKPKATFETVAVPMSNTQYAVYSAARALEREIESKSDDDASVHRSYSRAALNFVFPADGDAVKVYKSQVRAQMRADARATSAAAVDKEHARQMAVNVRKLKGSKLWSSDSLLAEHSPKFAAILKALQSEPGCAMMYSRFRSLEGLGLMAHLLMRRGFRRLEVVRTDGKGRRFALVGAGRGPAFMVPDFGTDDGADLLRLYRGDRLSQRMEASARRLFGVTDLDNRRGSLVKLIMISASGAAGIDLKGVRNVHILEPHWHSTLLDQVAGRAIRMNSHASLPPEERTVLIRTYVATFSQSQRRAPEFADLRKSDDGKTSDEVLVDISARKAVTLGGLRTLMERAAIDCGAWGDACFDDNAPRDKEIFTRSSLQR